MQKSLAESFSEELETWLESIQYYSVQMEALDSKLYDIIRRNSIVGIAAKVNFYQEKLTNLSEKFDSILESIEEQQSEIKVDGKFKEDFLLHYEVEKEQEELRKKMKQLEKTLSNLKFECNLFIDSPKTNQ